MASKLKFVHLVDSEDLTPGGREKTNVTFDINDDINVHEFLSYFVRFAVAAGFNPDNINDAIDAWAEATKRME